MEKAEGFLKSLGFPRLEVHDHLGHFDFRKAGRRIIVAGPMGSGKTEFSARVWRDSRVLKGKSGRVQSMTSSGGADRREVFFIRSGLDAARFPGYPDDALAYRGGYERLGRRIGRARDSFELERLIAANRGCGTWIIDEASFYDERLAYLVRQQAEERGLTFIFPTLILNFRREIFNATARLLLEHATDIYALSAYCEHPDCCEDSLYTYRYYLVEGEEAAAPYFDPLIVVGGDARKDDPREPNYCTRCDAHHRLPGKEYTFLDLKPLGEAFARGDRAGLMDELEALARMPMASLFARRLTKVPALSDAEEATLRLPLLAEKALLFLYAEMNLLREESFVEAAARLNLDMGYLEARLKDAGRPLPAADGGAQGLLFE
jgi:thymidine kinase